MKRGKIILFVTILAFPLCFLQAQTKYYNAAQFPLIGKISDDTETLYERLPVYLKDQCREPVWKLGKNTAGLAIRFRTNCSSIHAKWTLLNNRSMNHMTDTGIKGLDLYAWENNQWRFVNSALPKDKSNEVKIISNMIPKEREYILFLPLYDSVTSLHIGVDSTTIIQQPVLKYPDTSHPIVVYGTSITQGGCASRPGMAYTNILARKLNTEIINLGFSGNGRLDYEIAELMSTKKDAALFVLDFAPNVTPEQIQERTIPFVKILRKENPETPILLVENMEYTKTLFDQNLNRSWQAKNTSLRKQYELLKKQEDNNIFYLESENLIGDDGEATVDGTHFTDLGFLRFANVLYEKIKKLRL